MKNQHILGKSDFLLRLLAVIVYCLTLFYASSLRYCFSSFLHDFICPVLKHNRNLTVMTRCRNKFLKFNIPKNSKKPPLIVMLIIFNCRKALTSKFKAWRKNGENLLKNWKLSISYLLKTQYGDGAFSQ